MATVKQIGGSWQIELDYNDEFKVLVNGEECFIEKMTGDATISFYMKRRNKVQTSW